MVRWLPRLALACLLLSASASSLTPSSSADSQPFNRPDLSLAKWRRALFAAQVAIPSSADPVVSSSDKENDDQHASEERAEDEEEESAEDEEDCNLQQEDVDLCQYVRSSSACKAEQHYIAYLQHFYCAGGASKWLLFAGYLLWMLILFYALSEVAESFLVPAVEWISESMQLPPAVAGVTLLSFAGGAPDLFTQLAAVCTGGTVDLDLAVASTLGSGLFISCVMTASVVLIKTVDIVDRTAFVRDISAYIVANLLVLLFLCNGRLAAWEAALLLLLYAIYDAIQAPEALGGIITTSFGPNKAPSGLTKARVTGEQAPLTAQGQSLRGTLARSWSWNNTGKLTQWLPGFLERLGLQGKGAVELPLWQTGSAAKGLDDLETGEELLVIGGRNKEDVEEGALPPHPHPHITPPAHHKQLIPAHSAPSKRAVAPQEGQDLASANMQTAADDSSNPLGQKSSILMRGTMGGDDDADAARDVIPSLPRVNYSEGDELALIKVTDVDGHVGFKLEDEGGASIVPIFAQDMGFTEQSWRQWAWQQMEGSFHVYIHMDHESPWKQAFAIATCPLVLFMHITNPSMHIESFSNIYGYSMVVAAPGFGLAVLGLGPATLHWWGYLLLWAACSGGIAAVVYHKLSKTGLGYASRMDASFAALSICMSCVWLNLVASEVVSLLQTFGFIFNAPTALIGGTILSWGTTVPELVATYTLAKMGHSTMAIAGCFAGPVFNLMVGLGLPVLWATLSQGSLEMELTSGIKLLVVQSVVVLALLVSVVPLAFAWRLHRKIGLVLLVVYAVFQILFVLVEGRDTRS
ncbi:hypothetical protein ABBQ32_010836 [Trebouxia sp. C0010 RCD-2024]